MTFNRERIVRTITGSLQLAYLRSQPKTATPKISFCTCVKNRFDHLCQTLLENIDSCRDYQNIEFVLLDYNCPDPRTRQYVAGELNPFIEAGLLTYYHFPTPRYFGRSHARNLAFRLSTGDILCNVDADNLVGRGFPDYVAAMLCGKQVFLQGPRDGRGLMGRICLHRPHFETVGGYDERMQDWGVEDADLGRRLELLGVTKKIMLPEKFCHSIRHDDTLRTRHHRESDMRKSLRTNRAYLTKNMQHRTINPNGTDFGKGRVKKNDDQWIAV